MIKKSSNPNNPNKASNHYIDFTYTKENTKEENTKEEIKKKQRCKVI